MKKQGGERGRVSSSSPLGKVEFLNDDFRGRHCLDVLLELRTGVGLLREIKGILNKRGENEG